MSDNTAIIDLDNYDKSLFKLVFSKCKEVSFDAGGMTIKYIQGFLEYDGKVPVLLLKDKKTFGVTPANDFIKGEGDKKIAVKIKASDALKNKGHKWDICVELAESVNEEKFTDEQRKLYDFMTFDLPKILIEELVSQESLALIKMISCAKLSYDSLRQEGIKVTKLKDKELLEFIRENLKRSLMGCFRSKVSQKKLQNGDVDPSGKTYINAVISTYWDSNTEMTQFYTNFYKKEGEEEKLIPANEAISYGPFCGDLVFPLQNFYMGTCISPMYKISELIINGPNSIGSTVRTNIFGKAKPIKLTKEVKITDNGLEETEVSSEYQFDLADD